MLLARLLVYQVVVDGDLAGFAVDIGNEKQRIIVGKRRGPEELAGAAVDLKNSAAFAHHHRYVVFFAARNIGIEPLHVLRVGIEFFADQRALVRVVHVPIVGGQMLVIPFELARFRIERDGGVAVKIGGRGARGAVGIAIVALQARVRHGIRDAPVERFADGIVGAGQSPGGGEIGVLEILAPGLASRARPALERCKTSRHLCR